MKISSFLIFTFSISALAESNIPKRIVALRFDRGSVQTIYLAPGMGSLVTFPCALKEVMVGRSEDLKAQISPNDKKSLLLNLKLNTSLPTNLIARCEPSGNYVFDVIPSKSKHQDVVEIKSSFGGAQLPEQKEVSVKESESHKVVVMKPKIFKRSEK